MAQDLLEVALRCKPLADLCMDAREASLDFVALVDRLIILADHQPEHLSIKGPFAMGKLDVNAGVRIKGPGDYDVKYKLGAK